MAKHVVNKPFFWYNRSMKKPMQKELNMKEMTRAELEQLCMKMHTQLEAQQEQLNWYQEQVKLQQKKLFGKSSEKVKEEQLSLFDEAEVESTPIKREPEIEEIQYQRKKKGKHHKKLEELPTKVIEYTLSEEEQVCPKCNSKLHEMSKNIRKELVFVPAKMEIIEHVRYVYGCRNCENTGIKTHIVEAKGPTPILKGSIASASLLSHIITEKYDRALPLYRQEVQFRRMGLEISRQTMSNWILKIAEQYTKPIQEYMHKELLKQEYICADETTVNVLQEPGKEKVSSKSYMWVYQSGRSEEKQIVLYNYEPSRRHEHAITYLKGYRKILQSDGYSAYDQIEGSIQAGCWAHCRRYFSKSVELIPKGTDKEQTLSYQCYKLINKVFRLEKIYKEKKYTYEEIGKKRQEQAKPILEELYKLIEASYDESIGKSHLKEALTYAIKQKQKLLKYLEDGRIEISNNRCENSIRPFTIGRKNWLFCNTVKGAESSAGMYSLIETAKRNGLKPYAYIKYLLERLPDMELEDSEELEKILPWSKSLPKELYEQENT